ncbi:MAG: biopolymer transporter ExbD [Phycisphaerales bacterium]|nr:biopolymer transporter ExbD [Phycisphaerales bacterium]
MRRIRRHRDEPRIDMTPMLDTIFLLLTFFLFALTLATRFNVTEIRLPTTSQGRAPEPVPAVIVGLKADGQPMVDNTAVAWTDLLAAVREARERTPSATLFIAPDAEARSTDLFRLMDTLAQGDIRDLRFLRLPEAKATPPATPAAAPDQSPGVPGTPGPNP